MGELGTVRIASPQRMFLWAMALMPLMCLPYLYFVWDIGTPFSGLFMFFVCAVDSFTIIIHECGHAATQWLFGRTPQITLYSDLGAAKTNTGAFHPALLALVYAGFIFLCVRFYKQRKSTAFAVTVAALFIHALIFATGTDRIVTMLMGYCTEVIGGTAFAFFCLFRAPRPLKWPWIIIDVTLHTGGTAFGLYPIFENMIHMLRLMTAERLPATFSPVNGGRVFNDIELAANAMRVGVPAAAAIVFLFGAACLGFIGYRALTWRNAS